MRQANKRVITQLLLLLAKNKEGLLLQVVRKLKPGILLIEGLTKHQIKTMVLIGLSQQRVADLTKAEAVVAILKGQLGLRHMVGRQAQS